MRNCEASSTARARISTIPVSKWKFISIKIRHIMTIAMIHCLQIFTISTPTRWWFFGRNKRNKEIVPTAQKKVSTASLCNTVWEVA